VDGNTTGGDVVRSWSSFSPSHATSLGSIVLALTTMIRGSAESPSSSVIMNPRPPESTATGRSFVGSCSCGTRTPLLFISLRSFRARYRPGVTSGRASQQRSSSVSVHPNVSQKARTRSGASGSSASGASSRPTRGHTWRTDSRRAAASAPIALAGAVAIAILPFTESSPVFVIVLVRELVPVDLELGVATESRKSPTLTLI
jgi:hypothetical protein